jgi:iron-sulfur cluster assembly accessory protein
MTTNVTVTERAALKIGEILGKEAVGTMLRVSVEGGGCSGFQYKFDTERERADDDIVIQRSGATVLIDPVSLNYMAGSEIDFVDDLIGSSFKVNNPKATASCGPACAAVAASARRRPSHPRLCFNPRLD